jgi:hypothetical protein
MTSPLEQANKKRTFWKIVGSIATVAVSIVVAVVTKGKVKLKKS